MFLLFVILVVAVNAERRVNCQALFSRSAHFAMHIPQQQPQQTDATKATLVGNTIGTTVSVITASVSTQVALAQIADRQKDVYEASQSCQNHHAHDDIICDRLLAREVQDTARSSREINREE